MARLSTGPFGLALALAGLGVAATPARAGALVAGAGRAEIAVTPAMLPLDGFGRVLDPLQARVLLLRDSTRSVAIAVVDQTSLFDDLVGRLRSEVSRATGAAPADVLVIASHSFSAPHAFAADHLPLGATMDAEDQRRSAAYRQAIVDAAQGAAAEAAAHLVPVRVRFATAVSDVNINRNHRSADGWWLGPDAAGPSDKTVGVLTLDGPDGRGVATLVNYPVQSSVMDHSVGSNGTKGVTADLGGAAVRHLERDGSHGFAFFLTGAAGDQMPAYTARRTLYDATGRFRTDDLGDAAYPLVDLQGERLADAVVGTGPAPADGSGPNGLDLVRGEVTLPGQQRPRDLQQIKPTRSYRYIAGPAVKAPYVIVRIGDVALVGVQAELSAVTGAYLRRHSPFARTLVVTMVDGAAKYMPAAEAYPRMTYEAMNAPVAAGSAETMAAEILKRLASMHAAAGR